MKYLVLFFGVCVGTINAQETIWSLEKCLEHANTNNIQLKQTEWEVVDGKIKLNKRFSSPGIKKIFGFHQI